MKRTVDYYLGLHYTHRARPQYDEGRYWLAWIEELPGCKVEGGSKAEAFAKLSQLLPEYIKAKLERGSPIPEPEGRRPVKVRNRRKVRSARSERPEFKTKEAETAQEEERGLSGATKHWRQDDSGRVGEDSDQVTAGT